MFKQKIDEYGKMISIQIQYDDIMIERHNVISCTKTFKGDMFKSIMQYIDIELEGFHNVKDKEVVVSFGVKLEEDEKFEYISWGTFIVDNESIEKVIETHSTRFTAYDNLYKSHIKYDLNLVYPMTVKEFLIKICEKLNYHLVTYDFINADKMIYEEKYIDEYEVTYRDILDEIAGVAGGGILLNGDDLSIVYPRTTDYVLDEHNLKSLNICDQFGPINTLVLSDDYQDDTFYKEDILSVAENGRTEVRISQNQMMQKNREEFIDDLFNQINGLEFYPFELESFGFCYLQPYDLIVIKDRLGQEHKCLILNDVISVTTGLKETISCSLPESNVTDYSKASKEKKKLYQTILTVDKQKQVIESVVKQSEESIELDNDFKISLDGIESQVEKVSNAIYKFETGHHNIFENCNQFLYKDITSTDIEYKDDMILGINKDYMQGKDICISVDICVIGGRVGELGNYIGAEFEIGYADSTKKLYSTRWYLGQYSLQYLLQTSTIDHEERIWAHFKIEDKEIVSVSNLKIMIALNAQKAVIANPKVEFGTYPSGFEFDVTYVRDNVETIQKDYTEMKQEVGSLSLQAVSLEEQITTIQGDVSSVETRLQSTEFKLTPTEITAMVNEKIGTDGELTSMKVTINKDGLDVKNGAISITNNNGVKVLYADTYGNLIGNQITINNLKTSSGLIGKFIIDDKGLSYKENLNIDQKPCTFQLDIHPNAQDSFMNWSLKTNDQSADEFTGSLTYSGMDCRSINSMFFTSAMADIGDCSISELAASYINIEQNLRVLGTTNLNECNITGQCYVRNSKGQSVSMKRIADLVG